MIEIVSGGENLSTEKTFESHNSKKVLSITHPYILIFLIFLIFSRRDKNSAHTSEPGDTGIDVLHIIKSAMKHPDLENVLSSVCSYLEEEEQIPIHTISGILQLVNTTKRIKDSSYRIPGVPRAKTLKHDDKHLSIIQVLKQYANDDDKNLLEAIESTLIAMTKFQKATNKQTGPKDFEGDINNKRTEVIEAVADEVED